MSSKKPSLYVVERKEVVILVILFILVTVLSFTMGVKYGENMGRKAAFDQAAAQKHFAGDDAGTGSLEAAPTTAGEKVSTQSAAMEPAASQGEAENEAGHADAAEAAAAAESGAPDVMAKPLSTDPATAAPPGGGDVAVDETDEYLLRALKEAGVEPQQGNSVADLSAEESEASDSDAADEELPQTTKGSSPDDPYYVIQVGSFPTKRDADRHAVKLRARNLSPVVLPSVQTKSGTWFRVAVGRYQSRTEATKIAREYKSSGRIENFFVRKMN